VPTAYALSRAFPNPFAGGTRFRLDLPELSRVRMAVYDVQGRRVVDLLQGELGAGRFDRAWNGQDGSGRRAARGVYFLGIDATSLTSDKSLRVRQKVILLQ
jgi:hypothetical protein